MRGRPDCDETRLERPRPWRPPQLSGLRTYYVLVATQAVSRLGSNVSFFAVGIAVFMKTSHATPIAIIAFCQTLPWLVGAGFAGALADRYDRRRLMMFANLGFMATSGLLLASFVSGAFQLWQLYALTLINSRSARSNSRRCRRPSPCWSRTRTAIAPTPSAR